MLCQAKGLLLSYSTIISGRVIVSSRLFSTGSKVLASSVDYYETLRVASNSSPSDIKKAYYELAKKYHPDRNKDDPEAAKVFQTVAEAYEVLGDEAKRAEYDSSIKLFTTKKRSRDSEAKPSSSGKDKFWHYEPVQDPLELFSKVSFDEQKQTRQKIF